MSPPGFMRALWRCDVLLPMEQPHSLVATFPYVSLTFDIVKNKKIGGKPGGRSFRTAFCNCSRSMESGQRHKSSATETNKLITHQYTGKVQPIALRPAPAVCHFERNPQGGSSRKLHQALSLPSRPDLQPGRKRRFRRENVPDLTARDCTPSPLIFLFLLSTLPESNPRLGRVAAHAADRASYNRRCGLSSERTGNAWASPGLAR